MKKSKFECKNGCKNQYLDMVVLSCEKCIKHVGVHITAKQKKQIEEILNIISHKRKA